MPDQPVLLSVQDSVATVTLNWPEVLNALDFAMAEGRVQTVQRCMDDRRIRAAILAISSAT